tara:strand:- start:95 stop:700 length:606 start_codon:yes stop_codon:yes gene_type:complete
MSVLDREAFESLKPIMGELSGVTHPNVFGWFGLMFKVNPQMMAKLPEVVAAAPAAPAKGAKGKGGKKDAPKKKEEDVDMDDLFGDDDDDGAAAAVAAKAKEAKNKKVKKPVIAQSLIMFEVKPLDSDTDLDAVAKRIFAINDDGIYWKTEYKKVPVAFGIFKLIIGVTVEDEKVSVDGLQEQIEAFEDVVQSVDIMAFNKI